MNAQDLKNSILQLAIQGKLVEQREEEGTAKELLFQIEAAKQQLIKDKKIKKQKPLPEITPDEIPFDIPESWEWVRFGEIITFNMGKTPPRSEPKYWENDYNWISIADMVSNGYILDSKEKISEIALNEKFKMSLVPKGTLLMSFKLTVGKVSILNIDAVHNEAIISIYPLWDIEHSIRNYLFTMLPLLSAYGETKGAIKGKTLNSSSLNNLLIPLPSIMEQQRIVATIVKLMPYVDKYNKSYSEVVKLNKKFPEDMQKSILQYAVQGKLVEQREEEGTAEELYNQIQKEKKKLIEEGKIKKTKALPEITEDEIPFDIPENWKWVRLGDIAIFENGDRSTKYPKESDCVADGIPFFGAKDMNGEYMQFNGARFITEKKFHELGNGKLQDDDLVCLLRGSVGKMTKFRSNNKYETGFICAQMLIIRFLIKDVIEYITYATKSPLFKNLLETKITGTAVRQLPAAELAKVLIPLPPLKEQAKIVAKIEEMLPYSKRLIK